MLGSCTYKKSGVWVKDLQALLNDSRPNSPHILVPEQIAALCVGRGNQGFVCNHEI